MSNRSYDQFCPMAKSLDLIGNRWGLLVVRELLVRGPQRFTDLQQTLAGLSPHVLSTRIKEFESAGIVEKFELPPPAARTVYALTERGRDLEPLLLEAGRWGMPLLGDPTEDEPLMPHLLPLGLKALMIREELPAEGGTLVIEADEGTYLAVIRPLTDGGYFPFHRRVETSLSDEPTEPHLRVSLRSLASFAHGLTTQEQLEDSGLLRFTASAVPWHGAVLGLRAPISV